MVSMLMSASVLFKDFKDNQMINDMPTLNVTICSSLDEERDFHTAHADMDLYNNVRVQFLTSQDMCGLNAAIVGRDDDTLAKNQQPLREYENELAVLCVPKEMQDKKLVFYAKDKNIIKEIPLGIDVPALQKIDPEKPVLVMLTSTVYDDDIAREKQQAVDLYGEDQVIHLDNPHFIQQELLKLYCAENLPKTRFDFMLSFRHHKPSRANYLECVDYLCENPSTGKKELPKKHFEECAIKDIDIARWIDGFPGAYENKRIINMACANDPKQYDIPLVRNPDVNKPQDWKKPALFLAVAVGDQESFNGELNGLAALESLYDFRGKDSALKLFKKGYTSYFRWENKDKSTKGFSQVTVNNPRALIPN